MRHAPSRGLLFALRSDPLRVREPLSPLQRRYQTPITVPGMHAGDQAATAQDRSRPTIPALVLLMVLSAVWGWWAWQNGGYFGTVLLPGTILLCLVALLFAWLAPWP